MVQRKRKQQQQQMNALCNPKENILTGLTHIKVVREVCQDLSRTTVFRKYSRGKSTYESADDLEEGEILYLNIHFPLGRGNHLREEFCFLFSPTVVHVERLDGWVWLQRDRRHERKCMLLDMVIKQFPGI